MLKDFKSFILRGNPVDLAVAVVIGAAFGAVVTALVKDVFTPLIAAIVGKPDFSDLSITIHHSKILYGDFINALVAFIIVAAVIFFFVVQPINKLVQRTQRGKGDKDDDTRSCPQCLSVIPKAAKRCMYCTSVLKK
jgi:large conductance mechanosensitive channel